MRLARDTVLSRAARERGAAPRLLLVAAVAVDRTKLLSPTQKSLRSSSTCARDSDERHRTERHRPQRCCEPEARGSDLLGHSISRSSTVVAGPLPRLQASRARARARARVLCEKESTLRLKDARSPRRTCCPFFRNAIARREPPSRRLAARDPGRVQPASAHRGAAAGRTRV